jgi:hypothetical protein
MEFEAEVNPDGTLGVPRHVAAKLRPRTRATIRLADGREISEQEIEHIALRQLEQRENVICFLQGEGQPASNRSFERRAIALMKRKR